MAIGAKSGSSWGTKTNVAVKISGVWVARNLAVKVGGTWQTKHSTTSPLAASVDDSTPYGDGEQGTGTIWSNAATVTASGGTAPYTYAWSKVSGDTLTVESSTAASTRFGHSSATVGTWTGVYRCTVTDAASNTATVDVTATIDSYSGA